jgi:high-affinity iron transporter
VFMGNALIGLREGLEASILILVIIAYLSGRGRRPEIRLVWIGVVAALAVSVGAGAVFAATEARLDERGGEIFEVATSAIAVAFITSMIFWMRHSSQQVRSEVEGRLSKALLIGPFAVLSVAFIAVTREGLEAALFVLVLSHGGGAVGSVTGLLTGVLVAVLLAWAMHIGLVHVDLAKFLNVSGVLLTVIAAGILASTVTGLQHIGVLPGVHAVAFDATAILPDESWRGHFLEGIFGVSGHPTWLALVAWATYLLAVLALFVWMAARVSGVRGAELRETVEAEQPGTTPVAGNR